MRTTNKTKKIDTSHKELAAALQKHVDQLKAEYPKHDESTVKEFCLCFCGGYLGISVTDLLEASRK